MFQIRKLAITALVIGMIVIGLGMAVGNVSYNSDVFGKGAPYISVIDPVEDKVTVTNPGQMVIGNIKFVDVFGQTIKDMGNINLSTGDTVFNVSIPDRGNIGIHTAYYVIPTAEQVKLGSLGLKNNDDLAMYNIVSWLPAHNYPGMIYKVEQNGLGSWVAKN